MSQDSLEEVVSTNIQYDDADFIQALLDSGEITSNFEVAPGYFALTMAARIFSTDVALVLLEAGADVNCKDGMGCTPLHVAIESMKNSSYSGVTDYKAFVAAESMIQLLLWYNADVYACDDNGWTSLHYAAYGTEYKIMRLLMAYHASKVLTDKTTLHNMPMDVVSTIEDPYVHERLLLGILYHSMTAMDIVLDVQGSWERDQTRLNIPKHPENGDQVYRNQTAHMKDVKGSPAPNYGLTENQIFRKKGHAIERTLKVLQNAVVSENKTVSHIKLLENSGMPPDMISKIIRGSGIPMVAGDSLDHIKLSPLETFKEMLRREWIDYIGYEGGIVRKILDPKKELEACTWGKTDEQLEQERVNAAEDYNEWLEGGTR